jgi:SAM-dependent methyltransferase
MLYLPTECDSSMQSSIAAWCSESPHILPAVVLDVLKHKTAVFPPEFVDGSVDIIICINMIHIAPFACTHALMELASRLLRPGGVLIMYGPYRVNGTMVASNVAFDENLKSR